MSALERLLACLDCFFFTVTNVRSVSSSRPPSFFSFPSDPAALGLATPLPADMPERDASGADFARLRVAMYGIEDPEQNRKGW